MGGDGNVPICNLKYFEPVANCGSELAIYVRQLLECRNVSHSLLTYYVLTNGVRYTVSSFVMLQKPERQTSIEEKRKYVVAELLETEKSYVEALKMIQEVTNKSTFLCYGIFFLLTCTCSLRKLCMECFFIFI